MRSNESAEMYLETIMLLLEKNPHVRAIDVAHRTGYSKPSVSRAMGLLKQDGQITVDENGYITLTEAGLARASGVLERHRVLKAFLIGIGVSEEAAEEDACRMEHIVSEEVFEKMREKLGGNWVD